jgi:hypothetical protein
MEWDNRAFARIPVLLSVIIPVRNEAENFPPLLAEIHSALEGRGEYEVVYVDGRQCRRDAEGPGRGAGTVSAGAGARGDLRVERGAGDGVPSGRELADGDK